MHTHSLSRAQMGDQKEKKTHSKRTTLWVARWSKFITVLLGNKLERQRSPEICQVHRRRPFTWVKSEHPVGNVGAPMHWHRDVWRRVDGWTDEDFKIEMNVYLCDDGDEEVEIEEEENNFCGKKTTFYSPMLSDDRIDRCPHSGRPSWTYSPPPL